ncbi:MAG TPA: hypothetical protein VKZ59_09205 [Acidobacteriota bacterium]|nr:hypothetical protein [Acidobacteriota bacterium]
MKEKVHSDEEHKRLVEEEKKKMRRLRFLVDLTTGVLYQDSSLSLSESRQMVENLRRAVLHMFPDKGGTFDLVLLPRFDRILRERWGQGVDPIIH